MQQKSNEKRVAILDGEFFLSRRGVANFYVLLAKRRILCDFWLCRLGVLPAAPFSEGSIRDRLHLSFIRSLEYFWQDLLTEDMIYWRARRDAYCCLFDSREGMEKSACDSLLAVSSPALFADGMTLGG